MQAITRTRFDAVTEQLVADASTLALLTGRLLRPRMVGETDTVLADRIDALRDRAARLREAVRDA